MKIYKNNKIKIKMKSDNDNNKEKNSMPHKTTLNQLSKEPVKSIFSTIDENFDFLNSHFGNGIGLVNMKYNIFEGIVGVGLVYIESVSDKILIGNQIVEPLLNAKIDSRNDLEHILMLLQTKFIYIPYIMKSSEMKVVLEGLLNGNTVLFLNGIKEALIINCKKKEQYSIDKPDNEVTTLASRDSFNEDLTTNCSLVIRRLPTPKLRFETFTIGSLSHTEVKLIYIEGICKSEVIEEVKSRIKRIDIDVVNGIGTLAQLIEDNPLSVFPKYKQTQRPDVIAKYISDGHFGLLCSNSPFGIIAPISFWDNLKTMDDYAEKTLASTYLRSVRLLAFLLSVLVSPLYISFVTFNHSIVPPALAENIAAGRVGVPFPSLIEVLVMTLAVGIIREASVRMPGTVGYFIGALAAVVIGQAAVTAGYVSASVIIVVAASTISSFAISTTSLQYPSRLLNYFLIILAGLFGMFGLINGTAIIVWHMVSLESFGMPYLYPLVPFDTEALKDTIIRGPYSALGKRFRMLVQENYTRMKKK